MIHYSSHSKYTLMILGTQIMRLGTHAQLMGLEERQVLHINNIKDSFRLHIYEIKDSVMRLGIHLMIIRAL